MEALAVLGLAGLGWLATTANAEGTNRARTQVRGYESQDTCPSTLDVVPTPPAVSAPPDSGVDDPRNTCGPPMPYGVPHSALEEVYGVGSDRGIGPRGGPYRPEQVSNWNLPEGVTPNIRRTAQTPLSIDPLDPVGFKPPKQQVSQLEMRGPEAPYGLPYGAQSTADWEQRAYAQFNARAFGPTGALDDLYPDETGKAGCGPSGFANGMQMTREYKNHDHWGTKRIYFSPPSRRTTIRYRGEKNPSDAITCAGSAAMGDRGDLGFLRHPKNAQVREWFRPPMPNGTGLNEKPAAKPCIDWKWVNRPGTEVPYTPPSNSGMHQYEAWRLFPSVQNEQIRYKEGPKEYIHPTGTPTAVEAERGGIDTNPVEARPTHRSTLNNPYDRPCGPDAGWGFGQAADIYHDAQNAQNGDCGNRPGAERINNTTLYRTTLRQNLSELLDQFPPSPDVSNAQQLSGLASQTEFGRRLTPDIQQDVDPSLLTPLMRNPYAIALPGMPSVGDPRQSIESFA